MNRRGERLLVVDDEAAIRSVVAEVLRDDGYDVVESPDGNDALARYRAEPYDLVIADIRIGGMDGISLLKEIRAVNVDAHVVIMTSHASMDSALNAIKLGAYDYLVKPFESLEIISAAVRRGLEAVAMLKERELLIASLTRNNRELERLNKFFREMAIRDGLTGLFNHRYFNEVLAQEVDRARRYRRSLTVLFIDVDHFKAYNDTHGHQRGDDLLRTLGAILADNTRDSDVTARWGGEEFVIMAPETDAKGGLAIAEQMRQKVADCPFFCRDTQPGGAVTVSVGVATLERGIGTAKDVIFRADNAVYEAKSAGRNIVRVAA